MNDEMNNEIDSSKRRRNLILFWVHIVLAVLILGGFVFAIAYK